MQLARILKHLSMPAWRARRAFPKATLSAIETAIRTSETGHTGQICFAVEAALDIGPLLAGNSARQRAVDVFSQLRVWDTEHNNGVLIYLLLADHDVEILADRGIAERVPPAEWERICQTMEQAFRQGQFEQGVLAGIRRVSEHLVAHFPGQGRRGNELSDRPLML